MITPGAIDLVIAGGLVIDGTGARAYRADVGVAGKRIVALGDLSSAVVGTRLEASGRVVCPGFIDMHAHSDLPLLVNPTGDSKLQQGITTEVNGNCGFSPAPLSDESAQPVMQMHGFFGSYTRDL